MYYFAHNLFSNDVYVHSSQRRLCDWSWSFVSSARVNWYKYVNFGNFSVIYVGTLGLRLGTVEMQGPEQM